VYRFCGGAAEWTGCPRLALGVREAERIRIWDRCQGRLSATESLRLPTLLVEAFDVLDEFQTQRARYEAERQTKG
jgi:hypothetical protein